MADFTGEFVSLISAEGALEGECLDTALVRLRSVLPFDARGFVLGSQTLPAEMLRRLSKQPLLPLEANPTTLVVGSQLLPIELLARNAILQPTLPIEFDGTTPIATASKLPIEVLERLALGNFDFAFRVTNGRLHG